MSPSMKWRDFLKAFAGGPGVVTFQRDLSSVTILVDGKELVRISGLAYLQCPDDERLIDMLTDGAKWAQVKWELSLPRA